MKKVSGVERAPNKNRHFLIISVQGISVNRNKKYLHSCYPAEHQQQYTLFHSRMHWDLHVPLDARVHCALIIRPEIVLGGLVFISPSEAALLHKNNAKIFTKAEKDRGNYFSVWYQEYSSQTWETFIAIFASVAKHFRKEYPKNLQRICELDEKH